MVIPVPGCAQVRAACFCHGLALACCFRDEFLALTQTKVALRKRVVGMWRTSVGHGGSAECLKTPSAAFEVDSTARGRGLAL